MDWGENSAHIGDKIISPYVSTWLVQGDDLKLLLKDPSESEYAPLRNKLCNHLVLLGLNAGSMDKITPAWHFFHHRFKKGTDEIIETASERYLKEYITKCGLPFEGAYMTDILKFQDVDSSLYIEPNSAEVKSTEAIDDHNFKILKHELDLLRENAPAGSKMLLVPLGSFLDLLHRHPIGQQQRGTTVPVRYKLTRSNLIAKLLRVPVQVRLLQLLRKY